MNQIGRRFGLSEQWDRGVFCSEAGVFLGGVSLLERSTAGGWRPRPVFDLNRDLSERFGLPVEIGEKMNGIGAIARALGRGDLIYARIATLHLEIPDPPTRAKQDLAPIEAIDLALQLRASGLLKADWDPSKHPRWPAGSPDSIGGEFAPAGDSTTANQGAGNRVAADPAGSALPVQFAMPAPFELPAGIPFPSEIVPPPVISGINPRSSLKNPYPDRPECEEQWAHAIEYCSKLEKSGKLGADEYRGKGNVFLQCVLGMVTEDCGGSPTS